MTRVSIVRDDWGSIYIIPFTHVQQFIDDIDSLHEMEFAIKYLKYKTFNGGNVLTYKELYCDLIE